MELLKGGHIFLQALPQILAALDRPLRVTFAGDGRERAKLEKQATRLRSAHSNLDIEFTSWLGRNEIESLLAHSDLLVMPSLWPEPFGLVGPEAGLRGVPVAAFAVGGVTDWLQDGVNGALAPGDPPTAGGLAEAVIHCLRDPAKHARMRRNAVAIARQFNVQEHLTSLLKVFEYAIEQRQRASTNSTLI
jgi:glycosyltransferase involved in cell wall biosynthesis